MTANRNWKMQIHRRALAMLLVVVMVFATVPFHHITEAAGIVWNSPIMTAMEETKENGGVTFESQMTVTDAKLVAENFKEELALTEEELALLESGYLTGATHTLVVPNKGNDLVAVDSSKRTLVAKDYRDSYGNVWLPVGAAIVYTEGRENVALTDGKGSFGFIGRNYTVEVTYEASVSVKDQQKIANAPYHLAKGVENMEILYNDCTSYLMLLETIVPQLEMLVDGSFMVQLEEGTAAKEAVVNFNRQLKRNPNGNLDLMEYLEGNKGYGSAIGKVHYLLNNGKDVKACMVKTYEDAKAIAESEGLQSIIKFAGMMDAYKSMAKQLQRAVTQFALLVEAMTPVYEDPWAVLDAGLLGGKTSGTQTGLLDAPTATPLLEMPTLPEGHAKLDQLVMAAIGKSAEHQLTPKESLVAGSTVITNSINCFDVTIQVKASIIPENQIDSNELVELDTVTKVLTLPEGLTKEEIIEAIRESGVEDEALESMGNGVGTVNYKRTAGKLPATLEEDISYEITYTPKQYTLSFDYDESQNKKVYYGYNHTLESTGSLETSYDYWIDGENYIQGQVYRVTKDVELMRTEGKARESYRLAQIVAKDYADVLTDKEKAILGCEALISDTLHLRVADNDRDELIVINGKRVTAKNYDAGCDSLVWKPVSATLSKNDIVVETVTFTENEAITMTNQTDYEYLDVTYVLTIKTGNDPVVRDLLNISHTLTTEAASQKADLGQLLQPQVYDNLASINKTMLNAMSGNLGPESKMAIDTIKEQAFNGETGKFYLYEYMYGYKINGLTYYYQDQHDAKIKEQVAILAEQLRVVADDPLLPPLLDDLGKGAYKDKIDDIVTSLEKLKDGFLPANKAINTESSQLYKLVAAIEQDGNVNTYDKADGLQLDTLLKETASNIRLVSMEVTVLNGSGQIIGKETTNIPFEKGAVVTDAAVFAKALATMEESLGIDKDNYSCVKIGTVPEAGHVMTNNQKIQYTWKPNTYKVIIDGSDTVLTFAYDEPMIILPLCTETNFEYVYNIGGKTVETMINNNTFWFLREFTMEEFKAMFGENRTLVVTREVLDISRNDVLALIEDLNEAIADNGVVDGQGNLQMAFIPVEVDRRMELILRIDPRAKDQVKNVLPAILEILLSSKYEYVSMNNQTFVNEGKVYLQTMVNMILANEGFGSKTVTQVVDENGDIKEMTLEGAQVIGAVDGNISIGTCQVPAADVLGGMILETKLRLGVNAASVNYDIPCYITIEDHDQDAAALLAERNAVLEEKDSYYFECKNNRMVVKYTLSDVVYGSVVKHMLLSGKAAADRLHDMDLKELMDYERVLMNPILADPQVDAQTIRNTFGMELSEAEDFLDVMRLLDGGLEMKSVKSGAGTYSFDGQYYLQTLFAENNVQESIQNMIAEKDSGITFPIDLTLTNVAKEYEALIYDYTRDSAESAWLTNDLAADSFKIPEGAVIVLLSDISTGIAFHKAAYVNLNGHKIHGDVTAAGQVTVVDNSSSQEGSIQGTVGDNVRIVEHSYYTIRRNEDGDHVIRVHAGYLQSEDMVERRYLAVDMAVAFLLNNMTGAKLQIGSKTLYERTYETLCQSNEAAVARAMAGIDGAALQSLANALLADLTDFRGIANAIEKGKTFGQHKVAVTPFDVKLTVAGEGDGNYIKTEATGSESSMSSTLALEIDGNKEEKEQLKKLCKKLEYTVVLNTAEVTVSAVSYEQGQLTTQAEAKADMTVDFSKDVRYVQALGLIAANAMPEREDLRNAVKEALTGDKNHTNLVAALEQLDMESIRAAIAGGKDTTLETMASKLGITEVSIGEVYHHVWNVSSALLGRMQLPVSQQLLGSYGVEDKYASYQINKTDWEGLQLEAEIRLCEQYQEEKPTASPKPTPGGTPTPAPSMAPSSAPSQLPTPTDGIQVTPMINLSQNQGLFFGGEVDGSNIVLDARCEGISPAQFAQNMVQFTIAGAKADTANTGFLSGVKGDLITNGAIYQVAMISQDGSQVAVQFKVILKGDVNQDGKVNNTDVVLLTDHWLGYNNVVLSEDQLLAADMDGKGTWNNTDAVLIGDKFFGHNYQSRLAYR